MRIVAGRFKGITLETSKGSVTRPTSDRARESLFNILTHSAYEPLLTGARVADLFAGSGALGLEALSRGARYCLHMETNHHACLVLKKNIARCRCSDQADLVQKDAFSPSIPQKPFDLIFTDPPYQEGAIETSLQSLLRPGILAPTSLIIAQLHPKIGLTVPSGVKIKDDRHYGAARFIFLQPESQTA